MRMNWFTKNALSRIISSSLASIMGLQSLLQVLLLFATSTSLILGNPSPALAHNMANNWSFETPAGAGSNPTGWTKTVTSDTAGGYEVAALTTNTVAYTGSQSVRGRWSGSGANQSWNVTLFQKFTPAADVKVKLRGRYRREQSSGAGETVTAVLELASGTAADGTGGSVLATPINHSAANSVINDPNFTTAPGTGVWSGEVNLSAGTAYTIRTRWTGTNLDGVDYGGAWFDDIELSMAPANLTSSAPADTTNVTLDWDASIPGSGAPGLDPSTPYKLYRATQGASYVLQNPDPVTDFYTDTTTRGNTTYAYYVTDLDTNSIESPSSSVVTQLTRPDSPGTPTYSSPTTNSVTVSWTTPVGDSPTYSLERAPDSAGSPGTWANIATASASPYYDSTLSEGTTYWYRVRGYNSTGYGIYSGQSSVTTATSGPATTLTVGSPDSPPNEGTENVIYRGGYYQWLEKLVLTASSGNVTINSLKVNRDPSSTLPSNQVNAVRLYRDDGDGIFTTTAAETYMGATTSIDQWISVSSNNLITVGSSASQRTFHIVADIAAQTSNYNKTLITKVDGNVDIQSDASTNEGIANSNTNKVYGAPLPVARPSAASGNVEQNTTTTAMVLSFSPTQGSSSVTELRLTLSSAANAIQSGDLVEMRVVSGATTLGTWSDPQSNQAQTVSLSPALDIEAGTVKTVAVEVEVASSSEVGDSFQTQLVDSTNVGGDSYQTNGAFPLESGMLIVVAPAPGDLTVSQAAGVNSNQNIPVGSQDNVMHVRLAASGGQVSVDSLKVTLTGGYSAGEIQTVAIHSDLGTTGSFELGTDTTVTGAVQLSPSPNTGYTLSFSTPENINTGTDRYYWVRIGVSDAAANGKKLRGIVNAVGSNAGSSSGLPLTSSYEHTLVALNLALGNLTTGNGNVYKGESNKLIERLVLTASGGTATINELRVDNIGTATASDYSVIKIKTTAGVNIGTGSFGTSIPLTPAQLVGSGATTGFSIYVDVTAGATVNQTFQAQVQDSYIDSDATVTGGPRTGSTWTIQSGNITGSNGGFATGNTINQTQTKVVQQMRFDAAVGAVSLNSLRIQLTAANGLQQNEISALKLFTDNNNDGSTSGETQLGSTWSNPTLNSFNTFSFSSDIAAGSSRYFLLQAETSNATGGGTFRTRVAADSDIGSDAQSTSGAPFAGNNFTVQMPADRPLTPTNLRVTGFWATSFTVAWDNPVTSSNRVWIGSSVVDVPTPVKGGVTFAFSPAKPSTAYLVRVMAYNSDDASSFSPPVRVNTQCCSFSPPHDRFTDNNASCQACHAVHVAGSPNKLLFSSYDESTASYETKVINLPVGTMTVKRPPMELCFNCHDGSGADADILASYDNDLTAKQDFPGHVTKVTATYNAGFKPLPGSPGRTQLPCMVCHDVHSSSSRGENTQRGNAVSTTKNRSLMLADFLTDYATSAAGANPGNWYPTTSTDQPYQYNYYPYKVVNTIVYSDAGTGDWERCTVCHHGNKTAAAAADADMVVAGRDMWLPTAGASASPDPYGSTIPPHTDRTSCKCHSGEAVGSSLTLEGANPHALGKGGKPSGPVLDCTSCHDIVYDMMVATSSAGVGHSTRAFHHKITVGPESSGIRTVPGSCTNLCHSDHGRAYRSVDASNLWTEVSTAFNPGASSLAYTTSAYTDFIAGVSPGYSVQGGLCISCHRYQQTSHSTEAATSAPSQNTNANESSGRLHAVISSTAYASSAHNYNMTMGVANDDNSWFQMNCSKCHRDNQNTSSYTGNSAMAWRGPHASDYNSMLVATTALGRQEQTCFGNGVGLTPTGCHGRGRNPTWLDLEQLMVAPLFSGYLATQAHGGSIVSVAIDNRHLGLAEPGRYTAAASEKVDRSNPNTTAAGPPTRHAECQDCHNPHAVTTQAYDPANVINPWPLTVAAGISTSPFAPAYASSGGRSGLHVLGSDAVAGSNLGVWGVDVNWNDSSIVNTVNSVISTNSYTAAYGPSMSAFTPVTATKQWQICFKCHSAYAYGEAPTSRPFSSSHPKYSTPVRQTPLPLEFSPLNYGYHPVITIGANQPLRDRSERPSGVSNAYNANWPSMNAGTANFFISGGKAMMTISNATGMSTGIAGHVRYGSFVAAGSNTPSNDSLTQEWRMITKVINSKSFELMSPTTATGIQYQVNAGLNSAFVPPWGTRSLVQCTDCHSPSSSAFAQGPHASNEGWALRGLDRNIKYLNAAGGTFNYSSIGSEMQNEVNFCLNCHRADVYNWWISGTSDQTYHNYSRVASHPTDNNGDYANGGSGGANGSLKAGEWNIWCRRCHAGGSLGSAHGSRRGPLAGTTGHATGKRLMNGGNWQGVTRRAQGANVGCWYGTDLDDVSQCRAGTAGNSAAGEVYQYSYDIGPP